MTFEAGRFHTLLGPPSCLEALVSEPTVARFSAVCIRPVSSVLTGHSAGWGYRCRFVRVRNVRNLFQVLAGAREPLVILEYAPSLFEGDGVALRTLAHHLRARSSCAMVILYASHPTPSFDRFARLADRSFAVFQTSTVTTAGQRMIPPGQTQLSLV